jgi:predicted flap endonuclease-1-like 5' DNA nuclease
MSRSRMLFLLAAALLLLWRKPWQRLGGRTETHRQQWFGEPQRTHGETAFSAANTAATARTGFAGGQPSNAPPPAAQPAPPAVEAALDALAMPSSEPARGEGMLPFEVLDDMQGQDSADAHTVDTAPPGTASSAAPDTPLPPGTVGQRPGDDVPAAAATNTTNDDLIIIEGIGPRANVIMQGAGITTFAALADTPVETLRRLLSDNGIQTLDPQTWPAQARLAAEGRHDELRELQGRIKNGRIEE